MRSRWSALAAWTCCAASSSGCGADCAEDGCDASITLDRAVADACDGFCATVTVTAGRRGVGGVEVALDSDVDGPLFGSKLTLDGDGTGTVCVPGPLSPGSHTIRAACNGCSDDGAPLQVDPFGAKYGLSKSTEVLSAPPWVPELVKDAGNPLLHPSTGTWDDVAVMAASVLVFDGSELLYYAGQQEDTAFALGVASRPEGSSGPFERVGDGPLTSIQEGEGGWNAYGQQAPDAIIVDGEVWMYYTGASLADGGLHIGLATSPDGVTFTNHPNGPVLAPTDEIGDFDWRGVGHSSVVVRDGVFELWYASGTLAIGYAISEDGLNFERYCGNPVFEGFGEASWDAGEVKAPEVVYHEPTDTYYMTWSGCDPCFQVGWAASRDGLRWAAMPDPLLPATGDDGWEGVAVQSAYIQVLPDEWRYWYSGNDGTYQALGLATSAPGP
jgi:hypothetical protein